MMSVKCEAGVCPRGCDVEGFGRLRLASHFRSHLRASCQLCGASLPHRPALRLHKALRCRRRPPLRGRRFRTSRDPTLSPRPAGLRVKREALPSPPKPRLVLRASVSSHASTQPMEGWGPRGAAEPWGSEASSDGSSVRLASPLEQSCDECGWEGPAAEAHDCAAVREAVDMEEFLRHQRYHCPLPCRKSFERPHEAALHIRACQAKEGRSERLHLPGGQLDASEQPSGPMQGSKVSETGAGKLTLPPKATTRLFACDSCDYTVDTLSSMARHVKGKKACKIWQNRKILEEATSDQGSVQCLTCNAALGTTKSLADDSKSRVEAVRHIRSCPPKTEKPSPKRLSWKKGKKSRMSVAARLAEALPKGDPRKSRAAEKHSPAPRAAAKGSVDAAASRSESGKGPGAGSSPASELMSRAREESGAGERVAALRVGSRLGCPLCGRLFARPCLLQRHFARRHADHRLDVPAVPVRRLPAGQQGQASQRLPQSHSEEALKAQGESAAEEMGGGKAPSKASSPVKSMRKRPLWLQTISAAQRESASKSMDRQNEASGSIKTKAQSKAHQKPPKAQICRIASSLTEKAAPKASPTSKKPRLLSKSCAKTSSAAAKPAAEPLSLTVKSEPEDTPAADRASSQSSKSKVGQSARSVSSKSSGSWTQAPKTPLTENNAPQIKREPATKDQGSVKSKGSIEVPKSSKSSTKSSGSAQNCKHREAPSLAVKSEPEEAACAGSKGSGRSGGPGQSGDPFVGKYGRSGRWVCPRCAKDFPLRHRKSFVGHAQRRCEVLLTV